MLRVPYGLADARQHPIVTALHDFVGHRTSIWPKRLLEVGHERLRRRCGLGRQLDL